MSLLHAIWFIPHLFITSVAVLRVKLVCSKLVTELTCSWFPNSTSNHISIKNLLAFSSSIHDHQESFIITYKSYQNIYKADLWNGTTNLNLFMSRYSLPIDNPSRLSISKTPIFLPPPPSLKKIGVCNQHLVHRHLGLLWYIKGCEWSDPSGSPVARCQDAAVPSYSTHQMLGIYTAIRSSISDLSGVIKCFQSIDTTAKIPALSCLLSYWFAASCGLSDQHPLVFVIVKH